MPRSRGLSACVNRQEGTVCRSPHTPCAMRGALVGSLGSLASLLPRRLSRSHHASAHKQISVGGRGGRRRECVRERCECLCLAVPTHSIVSLHSPPLRSTPSFHSFLSTHQYPHVLHARLLHAIVRPLSTINLEKYVHSYHVAIYQAIPPLLRPSLLPLLSMTLLISPS